MPLCSPFAHFEFMHIDCYNEFYNPHASARLADLEFPKLGEFDFVFMSSVCTHLSDSEMRLYLELRCALDTQRWNILGHFPAPSIPMWRTSC